MTPVGGIRTGSFTAIGTGRAPRARSVGGPGASKTVQAFPAVPAADRVEPAEIVERYVPRHQRPDVAFLAHLIATKEHLPQTRERRRAEPQTAIAIYGAAVALTHTMRTPAPGSALKISA